MTVPSKMNLCLGCVHLRWVNDEVTIPPKCEAFRKRIPEEIFYGGQDHRLPIKGDGGITFDERSDKPGYEDRYEASK